MRWLAVVAAAVLVPAIPSLAAAQPGMTQPQPPGATELVPLAPEALRIHGDAKSENVALALSLGGTIASYALIIGAVADVADDGESEGGRYAALMTVGSLGASFAPSFGHWYAGKFATPGLGMRAAASGLALTAAMWALSECPLFSSEDDCNDTTGPAVLAWGALGLWVAGTIHDIATAPGRVRDYNKRVTGGLAIVPMVKSGGGGLSLAGNF